MGVQAIPLPEETGAGAALRRALVLLTCTSITFLCAMTITIANVSLPQIQGVLSASFSGSLGYIDLLAPASETQPAPNAPKAAPAAVDPGAR